MTFYDYFQTPLQPYADNLVSDTYKVFEEDQSKYDEYEVALNLALGKLEKNKIATIYYIGAGRGGILSRIVQASKDTKRKIKVYVI